MSRFMIAALLVASSFGMSEPRQAQAGAIPWTYNAVFGYGPMFPRRAAHRAGYAPRFSAYRAPMPWGANYGGGYYGGSGFNGPTATPGLSSSFHRPTSYTSNYGPSYYGGGFVSSRGFASSQNGCNPCGYSACSPCGSGCSSGNCPSGNCATTSSGSGYSPEPIADTNHNMKAPTPTFKPPVKPTVTEEAPVPDPVDDFVGVKRRENDNENTGNTGPFISPKLDASPAGGSTIPTPPVSTIPKTPTTTIPLGNSEAPPSTIPLGGVVPMPEGTGSAAPMAPITRPFAPPLGGSTIPGTSSGSTIPNDGNSTIPAPKSFPDTTPAPKTYDLNKPAPVEPSPEEKIPALLPETSAKPLQIESAPVARLVVERKRVVMQAGYRMPALSRIDVPTQQILEAGSSKLAIR